MAQLAIKGHPTRGKEVIEILKMLGGKNIHNYGGTFNECYAIDNNKICTIYTSVAEIDNHTIFTLEQFEEKYPYKVGDKVELNGIGVEITGMYWIDNTINYEGESIKLGSKYDCLSVQDLKPYKEEIMEDKGTLEQIDLTRELRIADEVEVILGDYEFVLKNGKTYFVKKKPNYPKTYKECCDLLGIDTMDNDAKGYKHFLVIQFQELLIARDAYWRIAGEQMRLGKPWKPDYDSGVNKYGIIYMNGVVQKSNPTTNWERHLNKVLDFPTAEMRDAFYENFKELINKVKELL